MTREQRFKLRCLVSAGIKDNFFNKDYDDVAVDLGVSAEEIDEFLRRLDRRIDREILRLAPE